MKFAKLFETGDDQVLVMIDGGDEGPELTVRFKPVGLGVCMIRLMGFPDTDEGWDAAERGFGIITEDSALAAVEKIKQQMSLAQKTGG
jgi:hypothetical protein